MRYCAVSQGHGLKKNLLHRACNDMFAAVQTLWVPWQQCDTPLHTALLQTLAPDWTGFGCDFF